MAVPLVSFVLVNWHTEELLPRALDSIARQKHALREVILVDNGSPDFDPAILAPYEPLTLIRNEENQGFAAANNQALAVAQGDVIVLLNCDAYLDPGFTARALTVFAANPRIGTVVPKILRDDQSGVIDAAGHLMRLDRTAVNRGRGERDQGQYDQGGFVFGGTAAVVAYRREMLLEIALVPPDAGPAAPMEDVFDESFFSYFEDVDLDWRAQLTGWLAYYEPRCLAWHRGHGSGGRRSLVIQVQAEKNRYLMLVKNDTLASQLTVFWPLLGYETWHFLRTLIRPWLWPAYLLLLGALPRAIAYRFAAGRSRKAHHRDVARWFVPRGYAVPPHALPPIGVDLGATTGDEARLATQEGDYYPLASVVILNWNGLALTKSCLGALKLQTYHPLEIIVVDNGSAADEANLIAMEFPEVRTLRLERNLGFAGGVNWGVSLARGHYIVLLNNDCVLERDAIKQLVYALKRSGAAAASGRLVNLRHAIDLGPALGLLESGEDETLADIAGHPRLSQALARSRRNHGRSLYGFVVYDAYTTPGCFYPSGAFCALSRSAVHELLPELFPARYFAYHEDVYLGHLLRSRGERVVKEPRAVGVHLESSTARNLGAVRLRFLNERNRWLNLIGFLPAGVLWRTLPLQLLYGVLVGLSMLVTRPLDFAGFVAAHAWLAAHPLELARWRARCRAQSRVPDTEWLVELSGRLRGNPDLLSRLALAWARLVGLPCRELQPGAGPATPPDQS